MTVRQTLPTEVKSTNKGIAWSSQQCLVNMSNVCESLSPTPMTWKTQTLDNTDQSLKC